MGFAGIGAGTIFTQRALGALATACINDGCPSGVHRFLEQREALTSHENFGNAACKTIALSAGSVPARADTPAVVVVGRRRRLIRLALALASHVTRPPSPTATSTAMTTPAMPPADRPPLEAVGKQGGGKIKCRASSAYSKSMKWPKSAKPSPPSIEPSKRHLRSFVSTCCWSLGLDIFERHMRSAVLRYCT